MTNTVLPHAIRPRTIKNPNQRLVAAGGEEEYQPHNQTIEHPTSPTDVGTPTMPGQMLVAAGGEEDHQLTQKPQNIHLLQWMMVHQISQLSQLSP